MNRHASPALLRAVLVAAWLAALGAGPALAEQPPGAAKASSPKAARSARPQWSELTTSQQAALRPLAKLWNGLGEAHKRKWLALSVNFTRMSPAEQATLHSRMTEWSTLSARQRAQARLNFAEVKRLAPPDERKAKWQAYQALSVEERHRLAESAATLPASAAMPVRPVPVRKLAPVPAGAIAHPRSAPRIQLDPPATSGPLLAPMPATAEAASPAPPAASAAGTPVR
ncbi:MAG: DUF3106 domain-containing protein [Xenophilus sp.]